jgi:methionyl-tRNA formyltransferase
MKIVFMGTPEFAVPSLQKLFEAGYEIPAVVTVADKPAGRGQKIHQSPVKRWAIEHGIRVLQPLKLRDPTFLYELKQCDADLFVVVAFRMLPEVIWQMPPKGTINLHGSLLPDYRGAAPINWAVMNGDTETGLTTFFIEKEIDTGAIIGQVKVPIPMDYTAGQLHDALLPIGAELMLETVFKIEQGTAVPMPQNHQSQHRLAPKIFPEMCQINWNQDAETIYHFIRGLSPHPGAWTRLDGKLFKIFFAELTPMTPHPTTETGYFFINQHQLLVRCGNGWLSLTDVQAEGKKRMSARDFVSGLRVKEGRFG